MTPEETEQGFEEETDRENLAAMNLEDTLNIISDEDRKSLHNNDQENDNDQNG